MATEMSITYGQLQELVSEVRKTQKPHTVHLADGVVAVVKPDKQQTSQQRERPGRKTASKQPARKTYTLESAYGAVADIGGPRDFDQMIREAKDERADRLLKSL